MFRLLQNFTVIDNLHLACGLGTLACLASMGNQALTVIGLLGGIDNADCRASMLPSKGAVAVELALSALNTHSSLHRNCFPVQPCSWRQRCFIAGCASGGRVCDKQASDGNRVSCVKQRAVCGVSEDDAAGDRGWTGDWLSPNLQVAHWVRRRQASKLRARFWHGFNDHGSTVAGFFRFKYTFDLRNKTVSLSSV